MGTSDLRRKRKAKQRVGERGGAGGGPGKGPEGKGRMGVTGRDEEVGNTRNPNRSL